VGHDLLLRQHGRSLWHTDLPSHYYVSTDWLAILVNVPCMRSPKDSVTLLNRTKGLMPAALYVRECRVYLYSSPPLNLHLVPITECQMIMSPRPSCSCQATVYVHYNHIASISEGNAARGSKFRYPRPDNYPETTATPVDKRHTRHHTEGCIGKRLLGSKFETLGKGRNVEGEAG